MACKKGIPHKKYSFEEKEQIVMEVLRDHKSSRQVSRESNIDDSIIRRWVRKYSKEGPDALKSKSAHCGNPFAALHSSKHLSKEERLELMVQKLTIENERLKKGYLVKGVGANKEFVTLRDLNSK